jgi:integrase
MHDLMMIAALTGARLEAIVDLRARDCEAGLLTFKPQKKEKSARGVPIHSALVDLVARRTKGKSGADDLFPEYPVPKRSTSQRERSFRASNEFTEYRRSVGVEEVVPGRSARWSTSIRSGATSLPRPSRWTRWSTSSLLWWAISAPG